MNQKGFINIVIIVLVVILAAAGAYFVLNQTYLIPTPTPTPAVPISGPITVVGEITCLPKKEDGSGFTTLECAIGLKGTDGRHYGLKNSPYDPEYKFSTTGTRVEVSGIFKLEEMSGPAGSKYDVIGTIDVTSIKEAAG